MQIDNLAKEAAGDNDSLAARMVSGAKQSYWEFIVDDGQKWLIADDLVLQLREMEK